MSSVWVIILFSVGVVGLFVLGLSLTLIFKGHNIRSEIGDNPALKSRGIKCAVSEAREQENTGIKRQETSRTAGLQQERHSTRDCHEDTSPCIESGCYSCDNPSPSDI